MTAPLPSSFDPLARQIHASSEASARIRTVEDTDSELRADVLAANHRGCDAPAPAPVPSFDEVYDAHFDFVWRSVRRLGVADGAVDDVVQDVFVVVHRRLADFEARASIKTWIFGVVRRVVGDHRRTSRRKRLDGAFRASESESASIADDSARGPHELTARAEAVRLLYRLLDRLDDDKREVFVLAELEQMSVPEIAQALGANVNTIYSRLRAARTAFNQAVTRHRADQERSE